MSRIIASLSVTCLQASSTLAFWLGARAPGHIASGIACAKVGRRALTVMFGLDRRRPMLGAPHWQEYRSKRRILKQRHEISSLVAL
jgi:hypothetical protein